MRKAGGSMRNKVFIGLLVIAMAAIFLNWPLNADTVITNGALSSGLSGWSSEVGDPAPDSGFSVVWDADGYSGTIKNHGQQIQAQGGALKVTAASSEAQTGKGVITYYQEFNVQQPRATGRLSFAWKKFYQGNGMPLAHNLAVLLRLPDGKQTMIWTDRLRRNDNSWHTVEELDLGGYLTQAGNYQLRFYFYLENGEQRDGLQTAVWLDEVYLEIKTPDVTRPTAVASPQAKTVSSSQVDLSWGPATDDRGVAEYRIYLNGDKTPVAVIPENGSGLYRYEVTGLRAQTLYTFTIRAVDTYGNYSENDMELTAVTLPDTGGTPGVAAGTGIPPAENVLKNSNFIKNSSPWVAVNDSSFRQSSGFTTAWDGVGYSGNIINGGKIITALGGSFRFLANGKERQGARYLEQSFPVTYLPGGGRTFRLSFAWKKNWFNDKNLQPQFQDAYIFLKRPDGSTVTLWSNTTKANQASWQLVEDLDISSNFNATGTYTIRLYGKLKNNDADLATWTAIRFDEVRLYIPDVTPPQVPGQLNLQVISDRQVQLNWDYSTDNIGVIAYRVYRKPAGSSSYTLVGTTAASELSFIDTEANGLQPDTEYSYYITAVDAAGNESVPSPTATGKTKPTDTIPPTQPQGVRATALTSSEVEIRWEEASDTGLGLAYYRIERAPDQNGTPGSFSLVGEVAAGNLVFKNTAVQAKRTYWYRVIAVDQANLASQPSLSVAVFVPPSPHGYYDEEEWRCGICHRGHQGLTARLLAKPSQPLLCLTCHDGWGSRYLLKPDLLAWGKNNVFHPISGSEAALAGRTRTLLACTDCHNPHGDKIPGTSDLYPRWLRSSDGSKYYYQGNQYCLACHGPVDRNWSADYWENTFGDHTNPQAAHYDLSKSLLQPASGTQITCVKCHDKHASPNRRLTLAKEEGICFKCHNNPAVSASGTADIQEQFNRKGSRHDIFSVDQQANGTKVECVNCHGPHTVSPKLFPANATGAAVSDPDNTKRPWLGTLVDFCLKCHDGSPPTTAFNSATVQVPYDVQMPSTPITTNASGWDKRSFKGSGHWNRGIQSCRQCHEQHGSDYDRLLKLPEDSDSQDGICFQCHKPAAENPVLAGAPDVKTPFNKAYHHNTLVDNGKHKDTENYNNLALENRHAECYDCHDPHSASNTAPVPQNDPTNPTEPPKPSGALANVKGVGFTGARPAWTSLLANSSLYQPKTVVYQFELCYKCHSSYSFDQTPAETMTDVAREFNPANAAYHPVEAKGKTKNGRYVGTDRFGVAWSPNRLMFCTDCHGSETAAEPVGPHGSSYYRILKGSWDGNTGAGSTDALCFRCHDINNYIDVANKGAGNTSNGYGGTYTGFRKGRTNLHIWHVKEKNAKCQFCHAAIPHGYNRMHLIVYRDETPYASSVAKLTRYVANDSGNYDKGNCSNNCGH